MSGHVPDWVRKNQHKVQTFSDGGLAKSDAPRQDGPPSSIQVKGGGAADENSKGFGGTVSKRFDLDKDESLTVGVSGHAFKAKTPDGSFKDAKITGGEISYRKKDNEFSLTADKDERGKDRYMLKYRKTF